MDRIDKTELYEKYAEYFKYNYEVDLPSMSSQKTKYDSIIMPINDKLMLSILKRLGIMFVNTSTQNAEFSITSNDNWENKSFVFGLDIYTRDKGWREVLFGSGLVFENLVPRINRQSNKIDCFVYTDADGTSTTWDTDLTTIDLLKMYNTQVDHIGGTDILGVLDI